MVGFSKKNLVMMGTVTFLLTFLLLVPSVWGSPGTSVGTASTIGPGTYIDSISDGDNDGYYNVTGQIGATLTVSLTYNSPPHDLELYIINETGGYVGSDESHDGDVSVSIITNSTKTHTIHIHRSSSTGVADYTITISFAEEGIPGFELLLACFSILTLLSIVVFFKNRKISPN